MLVAAVIFVVARHLFAIHKGTSYVEHYEDCSALARSTYLEPAHKEQV